MYIFVLIYTPKFHRYYNISRQITNTLIQNYLERIVLLYLELQFPLSAQSLRFATRIPPQSGLKEELFLYFVNLNLFNLNLFNLNLFQILTVIARNVAIFFFLTAKGAKFYAKFAKFLTD